jgi:hypothetical protein
MSERRRKIQVRGGQRGSREREREREDRYRKKKQLERNKMDLGSKWTEKVGNEKECYDRYKKNDLKGREK